MEEWKTDFVQPYSSSFYHFFAFRTFFFKKRIDITSLRIRRRVFPFVIGQFYWFNIYQSQDGREEQGQMMEMNLFLDQVHRHSLSHDTIIERCIIVFLVGQIFRDPFPRDRVRSRHGMSGIQILPKTVKRINIPQFFICICKHI